MTLDRRVRDILEELVSFADEDGFLYYGSLTPNLGKLSLKARALLKELEQ